ncbi:MAG: PQQ-binding-like beta-propeller repeat protein [Dokdonella sp.]
MNHRSAVVLVVLAALSTLGSAATKPRTGSDPVEGYWLGTTGTDKERIDLGFEFRRNDAGKLVVRVTEPNMGYYGMDLGEAKRDRDRVMSEAVGLSLTLKGDTLNGTYPGPRGIATLQRVSQLPQQAPVPEVPTGPAPLWQTRVGGQVYAAPIVADGVAYIGTTGGIFNAVTTDNGKIAWTFAAGGPIFGAAAVTGDAIYFVCDTGFLYRLERASGKQVWRYDLGDRAMPRLLPHPSAGDWDWQAPQPVLADGTVYVGSGDGSFHAVDAANGQRRWRFATKGKIRTGAAIDGARVVFGSADHFLYSLDRASGQQVWSYDSHADVDGTPLVAGKRIYFGNRGVGLHALDAESGKELWRLYFWGSWVESTPTLQDGVLYIGSSDLGQVSAINPDDGHVLWRGDVYGWTFGTPVVNDDRLYSGTAGGTPYFIRHVAGFVTLDRKTGKMLTRWPFADSGGYEWGIAGSPARSGDVVIVATIAGSLFAFPLR